MIFYNPTDGQVLTNNIPSKPRHCFLMTQLGGRIPLEVNAIRKAISTCCKKAKFTIIDASTDITGRDFLLKIWKQIAASPLSVGICHEEMPPKTLLNIFYEIGVAQALGKETLIIKSPNIVIPSDFVRTEYIIFDAKFKSNFSKFLLGLDAQADFYETVADNLEKDPVLSLDYLRRAFLIKGDSGIRKKARSILKDPSLKDRAKNSVELLAAAF